MLPIQNTTTTNSFDFWRQRTNEMAIAFSNCVVTTDANASSTSATGNAAITGTFTASNGFISSNTGRYYVGNSSANGYLSPLTFGLGNSSVYFTIGSNNVSLVNNNLIVSSNTSTNLVANSTGIKISNSSSNVSITIPTTAQYADGNYFLCANGSWVLVGTGTLVKNIEINVTSAGNKTVDSFPRTTSSAAEYLLHVYDNNANNKMFSKVLVAHDYGTAYITEFAQIISNTNIGSFSALISGTDVVLNFTPTVTSCNVKFTRIIA